MNPRSVDALASATTSIRSGEGAGRTFFKTLLLVSTLLGGGLAVAPADAALTITTTGTISSGFETGGLFGLPAGMTSLVGDRYTLIVHYDYLGPNYFTPGDGSFAVDSEIPGITGFVTAIVNGVPLTTSLTNSLLGTTLVEDMFDFFGANQGSSNTGANVNVFQSLSCGSPCIPYADLNAPVNYLPGPFEGADQYTFTGAGNPATAPFATFIGAEATFLQVPEPPSWALLAAGLLGLGMLVRRRQA
jgi:hypothetical protein